MITSRTHSHPSPRFPMISGVIHAIAGQPTNVYEAKTKQHPTGTQKGFNTLYKAGVVGFDKRSKRFSLRVPRVVSKCTSCSFPAVRIPPSLRLMRYFLSVYNTFSDQEVRTALVTATINSGLALNFRTKNDPVLAFFVNPYAASNGNDGIHVDVVYFNHMTQKPSLGFSKQILENNVYFGIFGASLETIYRSELQSTIEDALVFSSSAFGENALPEAASAYIWKTSLGPREKSKKLAEYKATLDTFKSLPRSYHCTILMIHTFGSRMTVYNRTHYSKSDTKKADEQCAHVLMKVIQSQGSDLFGFSESLSQSEISTVYKSLGTYGNPIAMAVRYGFEESIRVLLNQVNGGCFSPKFLKESAQTQGDRACKSDQKSAQQRVMQGRFDLPSRVDLSPEEMRRLGPAAKQVRMA